MLSQLIANGIAVGCLYALVATGLSLIYRTTRILHVAHGAAYTVGAYLLFLFFIELQLPIVPAVVISLVLVGVFGVLMNCAVFEPLERIKAPHMIALLSSLGIYTITVNFVAMIFGNETKRLIPGIERTYHFGDIILNRMQLYQIITVFIVFPILFYLLKYTTWGRQLRAVCDNPKLALVMGINVQMIRYSVFIVGSILAGGAAMLSALDAGMDPYVGMPVFLNGAVAMIIGGVGTFGGAAAGGFFIALLQSLVVFQFSGRWIDAVTFSVLILFLVFRPEGIFGVRKRIEEGGG